MFQSEPSVGSLWGRSSEERATRRAADFTLNSYSDLFKPSSSSRWDPCVWLPWSECRCERLYSSGSSTVVWKYRKICQYLKQQTAAEVSWHFGLCWEQSGAGAPWMCLSCPSCLFVASLCFQLVVTVQMCVHYLNRTSGVDVHADDALWWQRCCCCCCCWDTLQADREAEGFIPSAHSVMCVLFLACVTTATLQRAEQEPCSWTIIRLLPDVFFTQQHRLWKQYELLFISAFWLGVMIYYFSLQRQQ